MIGWLVSDELERILKETVVAVRNYPGICLEGLSKTTKNLVQHILSQGRELNPGPPEYEAQ
jgi:hypothetical protein